MSTLCKCGGIDFNSELTLTRFKDAMNHIQLSKDSNCYLCYNKDTKCECAIVYATRKPCCSKCVKVLDVIISTVFDCRWITIKGIVHVMTVKLQYHTGRQLLTTIHKHDKPEATLENYVKNVELHCNGKLLNLDSIIILPESPNLTVVPSYKTLARQFNSKDYTCMCPITLEEIGEFSLCFTCMNAFERSMIAGLAICPYCRQNL